MLQQNFAYILEKKRDNHPTDIAVVEAHTFQRYTYDDLCRRVSRLANALKDLGVSRGHCISCLTANTVEYLDIFMAAARLGALVSPINYRLSPSEVKKILDDAKPKIFIFDAAFSDLAEEAARAYPFKTILFFGEGECSWAYRMEEWLKQYPDSGPDIVGDSDDPLLLLYTAGSTGMPKGVPLKHTNLFFNAINWIIDFGITKSDYTLTVIPLFHIGGHMLWTLPHLLVGAKVLLQRRFEPELTLRLLAQEEITNVFLLPTMLKMMVATADWQNHVPRSLRFIGAGGEPVPERIASAFAQMGVRVLNAYGLTETSDGTTAVRVEHAPARSANCIGKPLTLTDARIVDAEGHDVGSGVEGELLHRGPAVVEGYWDRPTETARAFRSGWLHTGDRVVRDEQGFMYFLGRKDDLIITGGENVYPAEIEEVILGHPKVADVAVVGIQDERWGQTIKAVIAPKTGTPVDEEDIQEYLKARLSSFKRPRVFQFVETLPKMGSGKLDRVRIKAVYGSG